MINYSPLTTEKQLEEVIEQTNKPRNNGVLLFKHSPRCGISLHAWKQLNKDWVYNEEDIAVYLINVVENRDISNKVSTMLGVQHESPQVLFLKNGVCVGNASHGRVSIQTINAWVNA